MAPGCVVCVGDLVEDVVVLLAAPVRPGTDTPARIVRSPGGSAANVARAVVAAGGRSRLVARVGDDEPGRRLRAELGEAGVDACVQVGGRTGTVVVLVDTAGERTMLTDRADASSLDTLPVGWDGDLARLHVPLYSFDGGSLAATAHAAVAAAHRRGVPVSVDLSSVELLDRVGPAALHALLQRVGPDLVLANAEEDAAAGPLAWPVVVKRGAAPVWCRAAGGEVVAEVAVAPVPGVVDTTGAGDAFAGGLLVALGRGAGVVDAVAAGIATARATVRTPGSSAGRIGAR